MSNSSLVSYVKISPNKNVGRRSKIDTITIHHMAGNMSIESCGAMFAKPSKAVSSNYGVGSDGRIGLYVDEGDRSWCSCSPDNDNRAITIEVANDGGADTDWHVSDKAIQSVIALCADVCKRNGIPRLLWRADKTAIQNKALQNMTVHRWFSATACPGEYLYGKLGYIADEVNKVLTGGVQDVQGVSGDSLYRVQVGAFKDRVNAEAILVKIKEKGFNGFVASTDLHRVQVGAFRERSNADAMVVMLRVAGFSSFVVEPVQAKPTPVLLSTREVAREVLLGLWGNGAERKRRLADAGYDVNSVQNEVNSLVG